MEQTLSHTIAQRRKSLGYTQKELADKLYVSDKTVSKWETGRGLPDISNLLNLARVLEVSLESLLENGANNTMEETVIETTLAYAQAVQTQDRTKWRHILTLGLTIGAIAIMALCVIIDLILTGALTWSPFPMLGITAATLISLTAINVKKHKLIIIMGVSIAVAFLTVFLLALKTDLAWYLPIGLPMSLVALITTVIAYFIITRLKNPFAKTSVFLLYGLACQLLVNGYFISQSLREPLGAMDLISPVILAILILVFGSLSIYTKRKDA
ncbi:helix-turn-helix transcriptional regulator [Erysipelothrix sp. HDW6C]|uniref:helix-turn-helix domain-containing protein n=1 Tax=Erysipelothrix sp. HDW6C TaxID=2714930 RepID=UPI00140DB6F8|nr:helix-turn-helix domain-containing protein [Erysipelothrix sp. HDW6C]QIK69356.1 helix-turn-helix transcriptional regulator [Erysipelothrix sp. HDW6C]